MPYDSTTDVANRSVFAIAKARVNCVPPRIGDDFSRGERVVVVGGASIFGALLGAIGAISAGHIPPWLILSMGAPVYALALYYAVATLHDAIERNAWGCAIATTIHVAAWFAWPVMALLHPTMTMPFWYLPALAFGALVMFASCWGGSKRVVYRACLQGALMASCAAYLGVITVMGA